MVEGSHDILAANPVGERLRNAREARGMTLDDVATVTRVPTRHLQHIENGEWDALPAITYSVGFARAYANAVGLNGSEIGSELRAQLGGAQAVSAAAPFYEPADPARVPPRSLAMIAGIIALVLLAAYFIWRGSSVEETDPQTEAAAIDTPIVPVPQAAPQAPQAQPNTAVAATGPVVLTAVDDVWLRISGAGGRVLTERTLRAGERYEVPSTAQQPTLRVGRPDALRVTVGQTAIPQLGPSGQPVGNVSLAPADLVGRLQNPPPAAPGATPAPQQR